MYNLIKYLGLFLQTFSLRKSSLRYISIKRIAVILLLYPLFLILIILNRFFMLLDEIFFFLYRRQRTDRSVFITGIPRSGTTYMFNLLYKDQDSFHCFKLWELLFAPSIIQKYIFRAIIGFDNFIGHPLYKLSKLFDKLVFGDFRQVHELGLTNPEEDEVLFLYNFSSLFYYYFYPGARGLEAYLYHDTTLPARVRRRNLQFYKRCVQRHNYVFDRKNKRVFIGKSPTFVPRLQSLSEIFPKGKFIIPMRTPYETIPSTISLNAHILSAFCTLPEKYPLRDEARALLLNWYTYIHNVLETQINERAIMLMYDDLKADPLTAIRKTYTLLELPFSYGEKKKSQIRAENTRYTSKHLYDKTLGIDKEIIDNRLKAILPSDLLIQKQTKKS